MLALIFSALLAIHAGNVTRFGDPGDALAGGEPACKSILKPREYKSWHPFMCAHRTLPCGTYIVLALDQKIAHCRVLDRGPYGAMHRGRIVFKHSDNRPGTWITDLDLSPEVANALGLSLLRGRARAHYGVVGKIGITRDEWTRQKHGARPTT